MRSPVHLRVQELIHALRGELPAVGIPFGPGADVFYAGPERRTGPSAWVRVLSLIAFPKPTTGRIAVKVINHHGDEVLKVYEVA